MVVVDDEELNLIEQNRRLTHNLELFEERIAELEFSQEDIGWQRLTGESSFELSRDYLMRVVARSRLFYLHNPLINRAVSLQADYVFAQGLNIQAPDKTVNEVLQDFLDDKLNIKEIVGHQARLMKEQTLMLDGNVFLVLFTNTLTGKVQIRSILVDEITNIICNPDDQNEVWFYKREWQTTVNGKTEQHVTYYPDIDYDLDSGGGGQTFKDGPVQWNAPIYQVQTGALAKSKYGIPEVYAALDWAQAHRKFLEDWATIVRAYAKFAFKLTVPGGAASVAATKTKLGTTVGTSGRGETNPASSVGSIFTTTKEGADLSPIKTSGATTNAQDGREIRMMVAAALGIPDTFFGDVDVGNLATARTLDRPTELKFRSRQQLWTDVYQSIITYVLNWAIRAPLGKLNGKAKFDPTNKLVITGRGKSKINLHVEVRFPPILEHSIIDRITAVADAVTLNGKSFLVDSPELMAVTIRLMFQALGVDDVDEITDKIVEDINKAKSAASQQGNQNNGQVPPQNGSSNNNGQNTGGSQGNTNSGSGTTDTRVSS